MIRQVVHIERYDWDVYFYMAATAEDSPEILAKLEEIGISAGEFMRAERHIERATRDSGMTYPSLEKRTSVVVVAHSTSAEQSINTFVHELRHLTDDIAIAEGIPSRGEEVAYLAGDVACLLAGTLLQVVCDCPTCRRHEIRQIPVNLKIQKEISR